MLKLKFFSHLNFLTFILKKFCIFVLVEYVFFIYVKNC